MRKLKEVGKLRRRLMVRKVKVMPMVNRFKVRVMVRKLTMKVRKVPARHQVKVTVIQKVTAIRNFGKSKSTLTSDEESECESFVYLGMPEIKILTV